MNKKNIVLITLFICVFFSKAFASDNRDVKLMRQEFAAANLTVKQNILNSLEKNTDEDYTILYIDALNYVQNYYELLSDNEEFLNIGILAIDKLKELKEKNAVASIRYLFSTVENERFKIVCLDALSSLIEKDESFTNYLNSLYQEGLSDLLNGKKFNIKLLIAYSKALGKFADQSSFDVLFKTLLYPIDSDLKESVENSLRNIFFDYYGELLERMKENDLEYVYTLYSLAAENTQIENQKLGELSEEVLSFAMDNFDYNSLMSKKIILKTLPAFSKLKWNNVSKKINEFFYIAQSEWKKSNLETKELIEIINCMGDLGTIEMAQSLSIFLGVLNSKTEKTKQYDEALVLSTVTALGKLGSKVAFDYLLYIEYINYSQRIKLAARQSIQELKW